ncbi:hypothetical protein PRIPAC_72823 [Pristionchus pacificus]|uniref:Uncharacterized protein n=1 Tax=Pristionchus pacificus TaxID=54126 RepID=A0A2A6C5J6_PRIPA|nr:hypothetical protein PRIPAC_72823 [Pristionchus pacificus]|eukprot:PDM73410.1 hypothetical protein PRIPAC_40766 [Pristionchus pacificus]
MADKPSNAMPPSPHNPRSVGDQIKMDEYHMESEKMSEASRGVGREVEEWSRKRGARGNEMAVPMCRNALDMVRAGLEKKSKGEESSKYGSPSLHFIRSLASLTAERVYNMKRR